MPLHRRQGQCRNPGPPGRDNGSDEFCFEHDLCAFAFVSQGPVPTPRHTAPDWALSRRGPRISPHFFIAPHRTGVRFSATNKVRGQEKVSVLLIDDQETVVRALEVARAILGECLAGQRDAARTVERLVSALNKSEVIQALDRMNRRRILRRVLGATGNSQSKPFTSLIFFIRPTRAG